MALTIDIDRGAGTLEVTSEDRVYIRDGSLSVRVNGLMDSDRQLSPWVQIFSCDRLMAEAALVLDEDAGQDGKIGGECILSTDTVPFARSFAGCRNETCRSFGVRVFSGDAENPKPIALGTVEVWNFPSVGGEPAMLPTAHEIVKKLDEKVDEHVADKSNPHRVTVEQIGAIPASKESEFAKAAAVTRLEQDVAANRRSAEQAIEVVSGVVADHIQNTDNPHGVTKEKLGLGNVDNTRDDEKPVSTPQSAAISEAMSSVVDSIHEDLRDYYSKSEMQFYTKDEVDSRLSTIPKFGVEVVPTLPTSGISTTTIYLVKTGDEGMNLYTEYIYVGSKWEMLGRQRIDLSSYATKSSVETLSRRLVEVAEESQPRLDVYQQMAVDSGITSQKLATLATTEYVDRSIEENFGRKYSEDTQADWTFMGQTVPNVGNNSWLLNTASMRVVLGYDQSSARGKWMLYLTEDRSAQTYYSTAPADAAELDFSLPSGELFTRPYVVKKYVTTDDVVPQGSGTQVIATIGGKEIKAPAGGGGGSVVESGTNPGYAANADAANAVPWGGVNGKPSSFPPDAHASTHKADGSDPLKAADIGALAIVYNEVSDETEVYATTRGGERTTFRVSSIPGGESILRVGNLADERGSLFVGTSGDGVLRVGHEGSEMASVEVAGVEADAKVRLYKDEETGEGRIEKNGKEVATEEQVEEVGEKVDAIAESVSTDNRFLVDGTSAAIQTKGEDGEFADEIRLDKGYTPVQGTEVVKLDKSVQTVTVAGGTVSIVFPDAASDTVRDFVVRINNTSADTVVVLDIPAGTYYGDEGWDADCAAGKVTSLYFTEIPGGGFEVGRRELTQFVK